MHLRIYGLYLILFIISSVLGKSLADLPIMSSLSGVWRQLESNYYLDDNLLEHKGNMNIVFTIKITGNKMIWHSNSGHTNTFFFDFENKEKTVDTAQYRDAIKSTMTSPQKLIHEVRRKYKNKQKTMHVKNTFELKKDGKTLHHIYEDLNGKKIYKVHTIYGRDAKSISNN